MRLDETVSAVMAQHAAVLEQALRKMVTRWPIGEFVRVAHPQHGGLVVARDDIKHVPSGLVFYSVETTIDDDGYQTRGWIPDEATT